MGSGREDLLEHSLSGQLCQKKRSWLAFNLSSIESEGCQVGKI